MPKQNTPSGAAPLSSPPPTSIRLHGATPAERIRSARTQRGLTQLQLSTRIGVTAAAVYLWERGASRPDRKRVPRLAAALSVTPARLHLTS